MSEPLSPDLVRHIAMLARLDLSDAELERFASELGAIVGYMDQLRAVDTEGVEPTAHVLGVHNVLRQDSILSSPGVEAAMANAPQRQATFFSVPKVLDQDSTS
jgi:aspartyl-tRNA(Asn)/glutamyl-tRNA(Gln) amidotransferase subunit C